jgi:hypothetical protein
VGDHVREAVEVAELLAQGCQVAVAERGVEHLELLR